jgi:hypothetical protein
MPTAEILEALLTTPGECPCHLLPTQHLLVDTAVASTVIFLGTCPVAFYMSVSGMVSARSSIHWNNVHNHNRCCCYSLLRMNLEWKKLRYLSEKLGLTPWYK